jgi:hypothetical protein
MSSSTSRYPEPATGTSTSNVEPETPASNVPARTPSTRITPAPCVMPSVPVVNEAVIMEASVRNLTRAPGLAFCSLPCPPATGRSNLASLASSFTSLA